MKLLDYIMSNPSLILAFVITTVSLCIIIMVVFVLFKLENEKKVTRAALEVNKITNSVRAGFVHFVLEDGCRILYASKGFYSLLGYTKEEARTSSKLSLLDFVQESDVDILRNNHLLLSNDSFNCEVGMKTKDNNILHALINGNVDLEKNGKHTISAVFVDISQQKQMQDMLQLEGERYRIATELSNDVLFEYDLQTDVMTYSEKYRDQFGRHPIINTYYVNCDKRRDNVHPDDWGIYLEFCQELKEGKSLIESEFRIKDRVGEFIWCQAMGKTIVDDNKVPVRVIGKIVNVDLHKRELEDLEYKATRDPLTGVYNKEVTIKKIEKYISGNKGNKHILMFIDFDDFKQVNDNYGHLQGDKVLSYVIGRIKEVFDEGEIVGRIGGDEFVMFAGNVTEVDDILCKAGELVKAINTIYKDKCYEIPISGSIGIATYPQDGLNYEQLLECADKALYRVKEQGKKNYMLYTPIT
ncbi:MAG: hypothetical protein K0S47_1785 [Herbinix sp.]|jgi:diguanylate cyclase (GGDEF)-like protein/PAS domain S-box-containing protein|nr:hypothetical protein [Herbinix sp.]